MPIHRFINPATIAKPRGFSHVVEATTPGRIIYISGQLGLGLDDEIVGAPGDFRAQAEQVFVNLKNALAAVGAGFEHVVKLNNYFLDVAHIGIFREVRTRFLDVAAPPASTAVVVSALARADALLEVEAIAVMPRTAEKAARSKTEFRRVADPAPAGTSPAKRRRKSIGTASRRSQKGKKAKLRKD
jgi:2-iminobutanoate/2-iminopropanoate deaminase